MCGICGIYNIDSDLEMDDPHIIESMMKVLKHRGPDEQSVYQQERISFGFTRLSLMDPEHGLQPFFNEKETIYVVCNGEIYNYTELKSELLLKGHTLFTSCDMEIIPHLYEEYGVHFIHRLNGQFAIALYDREQDSLYLIRDQMGICPLFYTITEGQLIFGSEIKALLQHPKVEKKVDLVGLDQLFTFPGLIAPRTLFDNVKSLENGHYIHVHEQQLHNVSYWDLDYPKLGESGETKCEDYYIEKLDHLLTKSVNRRLVADAPIGLYLSGGLDSSLIAAKAALGGGDQKKSFSITFHDKSFTEDKYQRIMADYIDSIHYEYKIGTKDIIEQLKRAVWHSETALKETYNTASLLLSQMARKEGVKAVLTGEGADELFAGYVGYRFDKFQAKQSKHLITTEEKEIRERIWGDPLFSYEHNYAELQQEKLRLYSEKIKGCFQTINCFHHPVINKEKLYQIDLVHKRSYLDYKLRLPEHLLAGHGDRMAYANSIEARYPFLDKDLIEFVVKELPPHFKLNNFSEKYILKKAAEKYVPLSIVKRSKFAFVAPGSPDLIREDKCYLKELLAEKRIRTQGYFDPQYVSMLVERYSQPNFRLNVPYEQDLLVLIITFCVFLDVFDMPNL